LIPECGFGNKLKAYVNPSPKKLYIYGFRSKAQLLSRICLKDLKDLYSKPQKRSPNYL